MNFCSHCGNRLDFRIPEGDDRPRHVCPECDRIHYINPRLVVGCVAEWKNKILLCQRAIEPRYGMWTAPAGFLEAGESAADGAKRETHEEAKAKVEIIAPYTLFNLTFINQIYLMFRAQLIDGRFDIGAESLAVRLLEEGEIPWDDLAFTAISKTLRHYFDDRKTGDFRFRMGDLSPDR
jgi:ADP-ribose pyrophosphatase YjhB (NUDIX family)